MCQPIDPRLNHAPCGFLSFNDDRSIVAINSTLSELLEYSPDDLSEKLLDYILPIASRIFYQTHFFPLLKLRGSVEEIYFSLRTRQGNEIPMLINAVRRQQAEGFVNDCILIPIRQRIQYEDEILKAKKAAEAAILAQQQAEVELRQQYDRAILLSQITQRIRQSLDLATIFEISTQEIRQLIDADRVSIFQFDATANFSQGQFVAESVATGFMSAMSMPIQAYCADRGLDEEIDESMNQLVNDFLVGKVQAAHDVTHAGLSESHQQIWQKFQIQASLVLPLLEREQLWGLLCIHQCFAPRNWQASEIEFIQQIANQLTIAIQQAALFRQVQTELADRRIAEAKLIETNTQLAHTNFELEQIAAQLTASNQELETFSYSVSHDLRAPLRIIHGFSQILLEDYRDRLDQEGQDYFDRICQNVHRMDTLIDDLLRLSRVTRSEMSYQENNLSNLVRDVIQTLHASQPKRIVECVIQPTAIAYGDGSLIRIVLENLLQNAWKFTQHHATAQIEFGSLPDLTKAPGQTTYFVRDDGAGFDMKRSARLFGAFQRLHHANEFPGTGIGLTTVRRIICRHGGKIWAEGAVEQGATFYFTLPNQPKPLPQPAAPQAPV